MLLLPPRASIAPKLHWISMQVTQLRGSDTHRTSARVETFTRVQLFALESPAVLDNFLSSAAQQRHPAIPSRVLKALVSFAEERRARTRRTDADADGLRSADLPDLSLWIRRPTMPSQMLGTSERWVVNCLRRSYAACFLKSALFPRGGTALPNVHLLNPL